MPPDLAPPADSVPTPDLPPPSTCSPTVGLELCVSFSSVQVGKVKDESGHGIDGTLRGAAQIGPLGKVGPAVTLAGGVSDSVDFGFVLGSFPELTVMAWVKFKGAAQGWDAVVSRWDTFKGYWLGGTQSPGGFEWWIDNTVVQTGPMVTTGWTHLAGTFDQSSKKLHIYVNGVLEGTKTYPGAITPPATFPLEFGHGGTDFATLNGQIDEVRIWSVVRTQAEICTDAGGTPGSGGSCKL